MVSPRSLTFLQWTKTQMFSENTEKCLEQWDKNKKKDKFKKEYMVSSVNARERASMVRTNVHPLDNRDTSTAEGVREGSG